MLQDRRPKFQEASEMMSAAEEGEGPAMGASRVGAELRAARQRLGWGLPDVAATLRIRLPYLEAIEEGRLADLPGNAYAVGFLRSYATFLGLDAGEVARRFRAEAQEVNRKPVLTFPAPVPERGVPAGAVVLLGVLLAAGSYAAWYRFSGNAPGPAPVIPAVPERLSPLIDGPTPPSNPSPQVASILPGPAPGAPVAPVPPVAAPAPVVAAPPPPPPPPPGDMVLRAKTGSWMMVREKNGEKLGKVLLNRTLKAGESWAVPKGTPLVLSTGNAGSTEVLLDGKPMGLPGMTGVKRDIPLEAASFKDMPDDAASPAPAASAPAATTGTAPARPAPRPAPARPTSPPAPQDGGRPATTG